MTRNRNRGSFVPQNTNNRRNNGLGNRRRQRNNGSRAPLELRAMGAEMTSGPSDPEPVHSTIKVRHRVQLVVSVPAGGLGITSAAIGAVVPGGISAWNTYRLMKLSIWGTDQMGGGAASPTLPLPPISVQFNAPTASGVPPPTDASSFSDWGTAGSARANLHILPSFSLRELWQLLNTTDTQFTVVVGAAAETNVVINLTLELQTTTATLPNLLALGRRPDFIPGLNGLRISGDEDRPD